MPSPKKSPPKKKIWKQIELLLPSRNKRTKERDKRQRQRAVRQARTLPTPAPEKKASKRKPRTKAQKRRKALKQPSEAPQLKDPPERLLAAASAPKQPEAPKATATTGKRKYAPADESVIKAAYNEYMQLKVLEGGSRVDADGKIVSMAQIAKRHKIEDRSFRNYVRNGGKRNKPGRKSIVSDYDTEFIAQHTVRSDRANRGLTVGQIVENVQSIYAHSKNFLTQQQARNWAYRTFRKNNPHHIKSGLMKAQKTTSKRSELSVAHQWRWFENFEAGLDFLRRHNTGTCPKSGKTFGELIDHFVVGGDETCLMSDSNGDLKIVGAKDKRKHERKVSDNRCSITMFRTGLPSGHNGPTAFILKGKKRPAGINEELLIANGCEPGSTIAMTENAFMTDAAWEEITPKIVQGYRALPVVRDNPDWWVFELVDGYGSHHNCAPANQYRYDHKVLSLKEEGDSSHVNQAYDRQTAKSDKQAHREALNWLMQDKMFNSNLLDQRDLVCTGMAAVRKSRDDPRVWESSFKATNTKPTDMLPFGDWIKSIQGYLTASDSYDLVQHYGAVDKYSLLPPFWQAMEPEKKRLAVDIVKKHDGNAWGPDCVKELMSGLSVLITELPALQTCIFCALDDPSHLTRGVEEDAALEPVVPQALVEAEANREKANHGLSMLMRNPPGLSGLALFDHYTKHVRDSWRGTDEGFRVSDALDIKVSKEQQILLELDPASKARSLLMADVNEGGAALRKASRRKLDNLGLIKSHSQFINNPERLEKMKARLELQQSIGHVAELAEKEAATKKKASLSKLEDKVPSAIDLYLKGDVKKRAFTKDSIMSLLSFVFKVEFDSGKKKGELLEVLNAQHAERPNELEEAKTKYASMPPLPPPSPTASVASSRHDAMSPNFFDTPEQPIHQMQPTHDEDESEAEDPMPAPAAASQNRWLFGHATTEVAKLGGIVSITPLELCEIVISCVEKAKTNSYYAKKSAFTKLLINELGARSRTLKYRLNFILPIAERIEEMVDDDELCVEGINEIIS